MVGKVIDIFTSTLKMSLFNKIGTAAFVTLGQLLVKKWLLIISTSGHTADDIIILST